MAKKGGAVQLQIEVDNEEDWEKLCEREGLILVDVYSDWCGPCSGMTGNLRKVKLEIGGDILTLAMAKCDNIRCLERFLNKSRPTWMFISNKKMIRLMFGADAPKLIQTLTDEIRLQKRAMEQDIPRSGIEIFQLTDEEQEVADEETRIREEAERIEQEAQENAINARREEVVQNLVEPMGEYNFVMVWPHVGNDGISQIFNAVKETPMTVAGKPTKILLKDEDLFEMFYYSTWQFTEIELEELKSDEVQGLLFQAAMGEEQDPIDIFLDKFYGSMRAPPGDEESIAMKISKIIKIEIPEEDEEEDHTDEEPPVDPRKSLEARKSQYESRKSQKSAKAAKSIEEVKYAEHRIPGLYVPENENCKVIAMRILFPQVTLKHDLPEVEPIPPHLIVAFDAFKKIDVLEMAREWREGTMRFGFFTSADMDNSILLAKTVEQYNRIPVPPLNAKLIVQVSRKHSEPLLSYCTLGPTYISPNTEIGEIECAAFFPEDYDEPESEPEPESTATTETEESEEGDPEEKSSEEGLEDVAEEEEDDDDADDDISSFDTLTSSQELNEADNDKSTATE